MPTGVHGLRPLLAMGLAWVCAALVGCAQPLVKAPVARDLQEQTHHLSVTLKDVKGHEETREIPVTLFRPQGAGPFPLVIMNHGRAPIEKRARQGVQRYEALSRYLVSKGFVVLLPTRVGYGENFGDFDPEGGGASCKVRRLEPMGDATYAQVLATLAYAKTLPFVDTSRWLMMGQSVGGLATVATVWQHPPGLVGAINFAGGAGGSPEHSPGAPCRPEQISQWWGEHAKEAVAPMLWLYWDNDLYWGASNPKRWHEAWVQGGGQAEFHSLPAIGPDGHGALAFDMDHWVPLAEVFLARLGYTQPGLIARPPATTFAQVTDSGKVPVNPAARASPYRQFLDAKPPRAFAVGPNGSWGWSQGDWALGRAIGNCQRNGEVCKLYAVDDDVVWVPPP